MSTTLTDAELKQAFEFFTMGSGSMDKEEYLDALKNVGIVFNKADAQAFAENEKNSFNVSDFIKDYHDNIKKITKEDLLRVFQEFDPEGTGIMAYDVLHRAIITYGERLTKEEADKFCNFMKLKPDTDFKYQELVEEMLKV